jgi:transcriptional regulator with XRE-family HTH domain
MGKASISRPEKLAEKLLEIRQKLNLSQNAMIRYLDFTDTLTQAEISAFERGVRVPPLLVLLRYARSMEINLEVLVDDALALPKQLTPK